MIKQIAVTFALLLSFTVSALAQDAPSCLTIEEVKALNGPTVRWVQLTPDQVVLAIRILQVPETSRPATIWVGQLADHPEQETFIGFNKDGCMDGKATRPIEDLKEIIGAGA